MASPPLSLMVQELLAREEKAKSMPEGREGACRPTARPHGGAAVPFHIV